MLLETFKAVFTNWTFCAIRFILIWHFYDRFFLRESRKLSSRRDFRFLKTKHQIVFNQFQRSCVLERLIKMPWCHFLRIVFLNQIFHLRSNDSIDIKTLDRLCNHLNLAQGSNDRQVLKF